MGEYITYKTSSPSGDLISFTSGFKKMYEETGKKAIVYQRIGMQGISYSESIPAFSNDEGEPICMPNNMFQMLRPLLLSQEYIQDYVEWKGEQVDFDMDLIRQERFTNQPKGSLNRFFNYVFPQMASDLSKPYIIIDKETNNRCQGKVLVNITQRHRNYYVTYFFLKEFQDYLVFTGLEKERDVFCKTWGLDIPLLKVDNFLDLTNCLKGCRFLLANASMVFQIAEAIKIPRILEIFPMMPNVIPVGADAYDAYHPDAIQYYFHKLINR